jgi:hypothetical protein
MLEVKSLQHKLSWREQGQPLQCSALQEVLSPARLSLPDVEPCSSWFHALYHCIMHVPAFATLRSDIILYIENEFERQYVRLHYYVMVLTFAC